MRTAWLALADGTVFEGRALGASGDVSGEIVFNTSMSGFEEILTDPSSAGQIVTLTYPEVGQAGFNGVDAQSRRASIAGVVVRSATPEASNFRSEQNLDAWLQSQGIVGISGLDTRALVRRVRQTGTLRGVLSTDEAVTREALVERAKNVAEASGLVERVSTGESYDWTEGSPEIAGVRRAEPSGKKVVVVDFGVKKAILENLVDAGHAVRVVPWNTTAASVLALSPDGVVLSNGPGNPEDLKGAKALVEELLGKVAVMGIGLGAQVLALGLGAKTFKLKAGHRGVNHPVLDRASGRVEITSQNHGYAVDAESFGEGVRVTHHSLFDGCCEGFEASEKRAFGVQFHPESAPGPSDARRMFARFTDFMATR